MVSAIPPNTATPFRFPLPWARDLTFPVYLKHTLNDAYFCFGDSSGLPIPNGSPSSIAVYIDRSNDGSLNGNNADDFGIWMPYAPAASPFANYWGTGGYNGSDPGGWAAVKHQITAGTPLWQVEIRISRQTMGGWITRWAWRSFINGGKDLPMIIHGRRMASGELLSYGLMLIWPRARSILAPVPRFPRWMVHAAHWNMQMPRALPSLLPPAMSRPI